MVSKLFLDPIKGVHVAGDVDLSSQGIRDGSDVKIGLGDEESWSRVRRLNLSRNRLVSLELLSGLRDLVELNASENLLEAAIDFATKRCSPNGERWSGGAGWTGSKLQVANFGFNSIAKVVNLSEHTFLRVLDLRDNLLTEAPCVTSLLHLEILILCGNAIRSLHALGQPPRLKDLAISRNNLRSLEGVHNVKRLQTIMCGDNFLQDLNPLSKCSQLAEVFAERNRVTRFVSFESLAHLRMLVHVSFEGNPLCSKNPEQPLAYRWGVIVKLIQIQFLDGIAVTVKEKVRAKSFFGYDLAAQQENYRKIFSGKEMPVVVEPFDHKDDQDEEVLRELAIEETVKATSIAKENLKKIEEMPTRVAQDFVDSVISAKSSKYSNNTD